MLLNLFQLTDPQKATELTEEPPPFHNKSHIKRNTRIYLSFAYLYLYLYTLHVKIKSHVLKKKVLIFCAF